MWCRSMPTIASWCRRVWRAFAPVGVYRVSARCWRSPNARRSTLIASDLAFAVAPRLNAAGRLSDMSIGIRCLLAEDPKQAQLLARELDAFNSERRQIEARMRTEALSAIRVLRDPGSGIQRDGVCLYDESWHQGVVGLVASRVKEQLRRPVIAFAKFDATTLRGSARSIPGVHVRDVLDAIATRDPQLIQKFGGHAMAAGLTLEAQQLDRFALAFNSRVHAVLARWARRMWLRPMAS
jgi:single-stranded-DNA-specific exonuclease